MKPRMLVLTTTITLFAALATPPARAQTLVVLHSFTGADGAGPQAGLIQDAAGNLYGTTVSGGAHGYGVVFKLGPTGILTVLHSFTGGTDGANPYAGLVGDVYGNLYGTTASGGAYGFGVVFKLDTTGKETVLHTFTGGADGANPYAGLARDAAGNLYGTTVHGGSGVSSTFAGYGVVFKLDTSGKENVLHTFTGGADGNQPYAGLTGDTAGNLYGTTLFGAFSFGVVFKLDTAGTESVLHSFTGYADGAFPYAGLIRDAAGNLYGTTKNGGNLVCFSSFGEKCARPYGVVFKVNAAGGETVLHAFTSGLDGAVPYAGLIQDAVGNLYGTTWAGGSGPCGGTLPFTAGCGTVFKLGTTGTETVLHRFGMADGARPYAGLIRDPAGNFYGTTAGGGNSGSGTVFKRIP